MQKSDATQMNLLACSAQEVLDCALQVAAELRREALFELQAAVVSAKEKM